MPPSVVDTHEFLGDWMLIHFEGPFELELQGEIKPVDYPALVIWQPGAGRRYGQTTQPWRHSWIHVCGRSIRPLLRRYGLRPLDPLPLTDVATTAEMFRQIHDERTLNLNPDDRILHNLFENWLIRILRSGKEIAGGTLPKLMEVRQQLESRIGPAMSLEQLAGMAGLSVSHFCSEFRRHFGISPGAYQINCRMAKARFLLRNRCLRVSEVSHLLGFSDPFAFSKAFRNHMGISPSHCRRKGLG